MKTRSAFREHLKKRSIGFRNLLADDRLNPEGRREPDFWERRVGSESSNLQNLSWMTKSEAARYLRISEKSIDRLRQRGVLRECLVEGTKSIRFRRADLDRIVV